MEPSSPSEKQVRALKVMTDILDTPEARLPTLDELANSTGLSGKTLIALYRTGLSAERRVVLALRRVVQKCPTALRIISDVKGEIEAHKKAQDDNKPRLTTNFGLTKKFQSSLGAVRQYLQRGLTEDECAYREAALKVQESATQDALVAYVNAAINAKEQGRIMMLPTQAELAAMFAISKSTVCTLLGRRLPDKHKAARQRNSADMKKARLAEKVREIVAALRKEATTEKNRTGLDSLRTRFTCSYKTLSIAMVQLSDDERARWWALPIRQR